MTIREEALCEDYMESVSSEASSGAEILIGAGVVAAVTYVVWRFRKVFGWMLLGCLAIAAIVWACANWEGVLGLVLLCGMAGGSSTRRRVGYKSPTLEEVRRDALIERVWKPYPAQNHPLPADTIYRYC